ncbi:DUF402 domain-containing protein [Actinopolymorpha sp. NPDC004070]|uniref:DUF402 domain-containing protein n=1 Tax=Actinopolymorpha sp. NPDC004070 TaxID=3154548 RepID=UPI0033BD5BE6
MPYASRASYASFTAGDDLLLEFRKWPAALHYRVTAVFLAADGTGAWIGGRKGHPVDRGLGQPPNVVSEDWVSFLPYGLGWAARWYAGRAEAGRASRYSCYVDITTPAQVDDGGVVHLVDLDLDVVRTWDGAVEVVDVDEFEEHRLVLGYPEAIVKAALRSAAEVREAMTSGSPPFDGEAAGRRVSSFTAYDDFRLRHSDARLP